MSEKVLKIIIYVAGIFCLFVFIAVRSLPVLNSVLLEEMIPEHFEFTRYGELYYQSYISHFREELPTPIRKYRFSEKHPEAEEADIFIFGDSFLDFSRQTTLPERLNDSLGQRVFFHRFLFPQYANPYCVFSDYGIEAGESRKVIYETVERNIPMKFDKPYLSSACAENGNRPEISEMDEFASKIFPENSELMYRQFLKRSIFTSNLFAFNSTLRFDLLGYISQHTPVYKTGDEPWLFLDRQLGDNPGGYYYSYSQEEIDRYCDHIALLQKEMMEKFNMEMVFLPIPNKYTIYHTLVNDHPYNSFLPMLYQGLNERGVSFIELYDDYMNEEKVLYYGTDSHWNEDGVDIALQKLISKLK